MSKYLFIIVLMLFAFEAQATPKNIIIMITDGCGDNCFKAATLYQYGEYEGQIYDLFPIKLHSSSNLAVSVSGQNRHALVPPYATEKVWSDFKYVMDRLPCSAACATQMATGIKTYYGAVGVDLDTNNLENINEFAVKKGKSTGVVTTVNWSDGTPAGFSAHWPTRKNLEAVSKSMLCDSKLNVIIGCGHPFYDNNGRHRNIPNYTRVGSERIWNDFTHNRPTIDGKPVSDIDGDGKPDAWTFLESKDDFVKLITMPNPPKRVIGTVQVAATLQLSRDLPDEENEAFKQAILTLPEENTDSLLATVTQTLPSLDTLALGALNVLKQNPNGFLVMIEGGAVDWGAHDNFKGRMLAEQISFNRAVETVVRWIETNSSWDETMLVVTSDHETGYITAPNQAEHISTWHELPYTKKGEMPKLQFNSTHHTCSLVPLYAKGSGSECFNIFADETDTRYGRYIQNTEIAQLIFMLWR